MHGKVNGFFVEHLSWKVVAVEGNNCKVMDKVSVSFLDD